MRTPAENADLVRACERALVAGARSAGVGPRQQVRAAARRFVRRHRRDAQLLQRALRMALASASLAAALLGFGPRAALAAAPFFEAEGSGPFAPFDVGTAAAPAVADLDGDGDPDVVVGAQDGTFTVLENTGVLGNPAFTELVGVANPLSGEDLGYNTAPAFGDLDADGDLDLVAGAAAGGGTATLAWFENTGGPLSPGFLEQTGGANPFDGITTTLVARPALVDLDADGDLDLILADVYGQLRYFENTGDAASPGFVERTGAANPLDGIVETTGAPAAIDADGDGDPDVVLGRSDGTFRWLRNDGTATAPAFEELVEDASPLVGQDVGAGSTPAFVDVDADGDPDLIVGADDGTIVAFQSRLGEAKEGPPVPFAQPATTFAGPGAFGDLDGDGDLDAIVTILDGDPMGNESLYVVTNNGSQTSPNFDSSAPAAGIPTYSQSDLQAYALGDIDGDGDLDLVVVLFGGTLSVWDNVGGSLVPSFSGPSYPFMFSGGGGGAPLEPTLGDLDADGDLDLVVGTYSGDFITFEQIGGTFVELTGAADPLDGLDVGLAVSLPTLGDADGDGDLDLVVGRLDGFLNGSFRYFENTESPGAAAFVERTGAANPLDGVSYSGAPLPALADLDGDGDLDIVSVNGGVPDPDFHVFENGILRRTPRAREWTGGENPLEGLSVTYDARTAAGDLDGDGDPDVVSGQFDGTFRFFENTGDATGPAYTERTGGANPMDGFDAGGHSAPELGDLDGDGDLDLVAGSATGSFRYYENTGSALAPSFVERTGAANPFDGFTGYTRSTPTLADLDGDGDLDMASGGYGYRLRYFQNIGSATSPSFGEISIFSLSNPFYGVYAGGYGAPVLADLDRDGDLDLVMGQFFGFFLSFENTGDATSPSWSALLGADNPFDGLDAGNEAVPVAADLDADGYLEFVTGNDAGDLRVYSLPEPEGVGVLGAAMALLRWLARRRRRPA